MGPYAHAHTPGRRLVRSRSLAVRMALLILLIPAFVTAAVTAIIVLLPAHLLVGCGLALLFGVGVRVVVQHKHRRSPIQGHPLEIHEDPELFEMLERLCALIDIERPEVIASDLRQANSWVIHRPGRPPRLFITRRLRELLTPEELQAVLAHELSHIANRDALVMTVVGMPGSVLLYSRGGGIDGVLLMLVGAVSSLGISMLSRFRELAADAGSAAITGRPSALASALLKVSDSQHSIPTRDLRAAQALNAFNLVAVAPRRRWWHDITPLVRAFGTHPDITRRLEQLDGLERRQHGTGAAHE